MVMSRFWMILNWLTIYIFIRKYDTAYIFKKANRDHLQYWGLSMSCPGLTKCLQSIYLLHSVEVHVLCRVFCYENSTETQGATGCVITGCQWPTRPASLGHGLCWEHAGPAEHPAPGECPGTAQSKLILLSRQLTIYVRTPQEPYRSPAAPWRGLFHNNDRLAVHYPEYYMATTKSIIWHKILQKIILFFPLKKLVCY